MTERIIHALRAVPRILLPLIPLPFSVAAALFLGSVVNLVVSSSDTDIGATASYFEKR